MDTLLDNIMVYWLTGTAGTATSRQRPVHLVEPLLAQPAAGDIGPVESRDHKDSSTACATAIHTI